MAHGSGNGWDNSVVSTWTTYYDIDDPVTVVWHVLEASMRVGSACLLPYTETKTDDCGLRSTEAVVWSGGVGTLRDMVSVYDGVADSHKSVV